MQPLRIPPYISNHNLRDGPHQNRPGIGTRLRVPPPNPNPAHHESRNRVGGAAGRTMPRGPLVVRTVTLMMTTMWMGMRALVTSICNCVQQGEDVLPLHISQYFEENIKIFRRLRQHHWPDQVADQTPTGMYEIETIPIRGCSPVRYLDCPGLFIPVSSKKIEEDHFPTNLQEIPQRR